MKDFNDLYFEVRLGSDGVLRKTNSGKSVLNLGGANHATSDKDREPLWIAFQVNCSTPSYKHESRFCSFGLFDIFYWSHMHICTKGILEPGKVYRKLTSIQKRIR